MDYRLTLLVIEARIENLPAEGTSEPQKEQAVEDISELKNDSLTTFKNELRNPPDLSLRTKLTTI